MTDASFLSYSQSFAITFEHFFDHNFQEAAIDEYFKPIDKNAKIIADMQLEKEEKQTKEMTKLMQEQMKMRREIMMTRAEAASVESSDTKAGGKVANIPPK
jgi:predicted nucleotidyltransferase